MVAIGLISVFLTKRTKRNSLKTKDYTRWPKTLQTKFSIRLGHENEVLPIVWTAPAAEESPRQ